MSTTCQLAYWERGPGTGASKYRGPIVLTCSTPISHCLHISDMPTTSSITRGRSCIYNGYHCCGFQTASGIFSCSTQDGLLTWLWE